MATSGVITTFPTDNEKVSKAEMRAQYLIIKNELSFLLSRISLSGTLAFGAATDESVSAAIAVNNVQNRVSLARDIAYGRVSI